ncbi:hypothetical protein [Streptomyces sp. CBMA29]|uniref:SCO2400 family protein n=1 Tax=Streptomyces sp. CBMA29 TaxID=1896314 RepID=UPI001661FE39|nr:hypothetical protein [Streptomyces sp. CBMA29]MBD0739293.1 hypothetical protein [Streptomyces sp. CBMA29]
MDYCYTCRRSVNGALVCPGCGAYAPETDEPVAYIPAPPVLPAAAPEEDVLGPSSLAPRSQGGRAARRRQLERWKKNRRRAGVATAVALFGGGVTVASMQNHGSGRGTTASSSYDTVTPVTLRTGNAPAAAPASAPASVPHAAAPAAQRHTRAGAPALPAAEATQPVTTSAGTAPLPVTSPAARPAPSTSTAPSTGTQAAKTGTATTAPPATTAPVTTTPVTTAPATSDPTTPPAHQGLCILILCLP